MITGNVEISASTKPQEIGILIWTPPTTLPTIHVETGLSRSESILAKLTCGKHLMVYYQVYEDENEGTWYTACSEGWRLDAATIKAWSYIHEFHKSN